MGARSHGFSGGAGCVGGGGRGWKCGWVGVGGWGLGVAGEGGAGHALGPFKVSWEATPMGRGP